MPRVAVGFHAAAAAELAAAQDWYRERSDAAAAAFAEEVDRAIARIGDSPERWSPHSHGTRRFLLRRFCAE
jgi:plasmid stabilization system protein ParE